MGYFKIVTDSTADLPKEYMEKHQLGCINLSYILDGVTYGQDKDKDLDLKEFYNIMRQGKLPTTSQVNPEEAKAFFEECIKTDKNILYLAFSSGLSGTYNSGRLAADEVMAEHPDCRIIVIDTLCASLGEGLIVYKAVNLREQGKSMDEVADWVRAHLLNLVHIVTVNDLNHLYRGGRVSKTSAFVGTLVSIKPQIHVDNEGHLILIGKIRGRKKSLISLVDYMEERIDGYREENDIVFICHGDCIEDAEYVRDQVKERFGIQSYVINYVGPIIGAHTGPGVVALFFLGESR